MNISNKQTKKAPNLTLWNTYLPISGSPVAGGRDGKGFLVVYTVVTVVGTGVVSERKK